jgi:hypothetical protein
MDKVTEYIKKQHDNEQKRLEEKELKLRQHEEKRSKKQEIIKPDDSKYKCPCGSTVLYRYLGAHLKRHTHKAYLNALMTLDINERRCKMLKK